ncbi:MAG: hypothetical protein SGARI_004231 [Bacillariaceae sp.]
MFVVVGTAWMVDERYRSDQECILFHEYVSEGIAVTGHIVDRQSVRKDISDDSGEEGPYNGPADVATEYFVMVEYQVVSPVDPSKYQVIHRAYRVERDQYYGPNAPIFLVLLPHLPNSAILKSNLDAEPNFAWNADPKALACMIICIALGVTVALLVKGLQEWQCSNDSTAEMASIFPKLWRWFHMANSTEEPWLKDHLLWGAMTITVAIP